MSPHQDVYEVEMDRTANVPIAEGVHQFRIKDIEEGESRSNNPMWTVTLACLTPAEEGKEVRTWIVLTPEARWKFEEFLDAVGAPETGTATASQFIGRTLNAQVMHEEYEGRDQAKIGKMMPVSRTAAKPAASMTRTAAPAVRPAAKPASTSKPAKATVKQGKLPADVKRKK